MFNKDNYHWTQQDFTEEGLSLIVAKLKEKNIQFHPDESTIYLTQRMNKKSARIDISGVLQQGSICERVVGDVGVEERDASELKKEFNKVVSEVIEELKNNKKVPDEILIKKTKDYKVTVIFNKNFDQVKNVIFDFNLISAISPIRPIPTGPNNITINTHEISMEISRTELKDTSTIRLTLNNSNFLLNLRLIPVGNESRLIITGNNSNSVGNRFITLYEQVILEPLKNAVGIRYTIE
ncbi:hypothetical protein NEAUS03_2401 [Nematocida ausubeli]|nr:hypothetical protein NEAUS03_2401 [Nematocida ausubeli]